MTNNELIQQLIVNTLNGKFSIDQIEDLNDMLIMARKKFVERNTSPDIKDENDDQIRRNNGLLPLRIDNYSGNPNKKYYKFNHEDQRSGISYYNLKDEYRNEIIGIENMYLQEMNESLINRWVKLANITEDDQPMTNKEISLALKDKTITEPSQEQLKQLFNAGYYIDQDQTATFPYILRGYKDENIMMHVKRVGGESGKVSYGYQIHSK